MGKAWTCQPDDHPAVSIEITSITYPVNAKEWVELDR